VLIASTVAAILGVVLTPIVARRVRTNV
jgi:hypothetical protein